MPRKPKGLQEAEDRLEESDFAGAREAYRRHFIKNRPSPADLSNLSVAEQWDPLHFRLKLRESHPKSRVVRAELAYAYLRIHRPHHALEILNELVEKKQTSRSRIPMLLVRFRAALETKAYDVASDDFVEIWRAGEANHATKLLRRGLLKELSGLGDPRSESLLNEIERRLPSDSKLIQYLTAKRNELRALGELLERPPV